MFTAFCETAAKVVRRSRVPAGEVPQALFNNLEPGKFLMQMRIRVAAAVLMLTSISQSATAQHVERAFQESARLELTSELSQSGDRVEFQVAGGMPSSRAWLLSVDLPSELVAVRARLEGSLKASPPTGDYDLLPIQLDGAGGWSQEATEAGLREWYQVFQPLPRGGFAFSDLTRGTRRTAPGGTALASSLFQDGFVLVSEFMKDPAHVSDSAGEWIELFNAGPHRANLEGWVLSDDGSNAHMIFNGGNGLWVLPRKRLVCGRNADTAANGGVALDYVYTGFTLGNGADQIVLSTGVGRLVDRVDYDDGVTWPDSSGMSIALAPGAEDPYLNDDGSNWCHSTSLVALSSSDTGTPGSQNDVCP